MRMQMIFTLHDLKQEPLINFAQKFEEYFEMQKYEKRYHNARKEMNIRYANVYFRLATNSVKYVVENGALMIHQIGDKEFEITVSAVYRKNRYVKIIEVEGGLKNYILDDEVIEEIRIYLSKGDDEEMSRDRGFQVFSIDEYEVLPLPEQGLGWFMIPEIIKIDMKQNWIRLEGKAYEINQENGEIVFQGEYEANASMDMQGVYDLEEMRTNAK